MVTRCELSDLPVDRGECVVCGESVVLLKDGVVRAHGGTGLLHRCPGSHFEPESNGGAS